MQEKHENLLDMINKLKSDVEKGKEKSAQQKAHIRDLQQVWFFPLFLCWLFFSSHTSCQQLFLFFCLYFCFFVIRPFFLRSDEFGRRSFMWGWHRSFLWGWHRSFEWVRSSFVHARTTSVVRMSSFVVLSCKGDITRSDESVRRSFLRGWHRSFRWVRSSFVHAFVVVVVVVFIVAVAAVTEPSYLAWTYFVWML